MKKSNVFLYLLLILIVVMLALTSCGGGGSEGGSGEQGGEDQVLVLVAFQRLDQFGDLLLIQRLDFLLGSSG